MPSARTPAVWIATSIAAALTAGCGQPSAADARNASADTMTAEKQTSAQLPGIAAQNKASQSAAEPQAAVPAIQTKTHPMTAAQSSALQKMQGRWYSADDPNSSLRIDGSTVHMIYNSPGNDSDDTFQIAFVPTCYPDLPAPDKTAFTFSSNELKLCYILDTVEARRLSYIYAGRGNMLSFKR